MPVAFLTRPNQPPAVALPKLRMARPDLRPALLIARPDTGGGLADLRARLATMGIAARALERGPGDPLVALWLMGPHEFTTMAAWAADLLLLGGGWPLLEAALERLEGSRGRPRNDRLADLAGLKGVWVPPRGEGGPARSPTAADFVPGGAPFDR